MRKEKILYILLGSLFVVYVVVEYYAPKPLDWTITFSEYDKNPFGSFILYDRLEDFFSEKGVSYKTLSEARDELGHELILTTGFEPSETDIKALFDMLKEGKNIFISAKFFSARFLDTLGLSLQYNAPNLIGNDSIAIHYRNEKFYYPPNLVNAYFEEDSLEGWRSHGKTVGPVLISKGYNKGSLILSSTPLIFTNYGLLWSKNDQYAAAALRLLPQEAIHFNRFYHSGKMEPTTPLRYLLSQAPLRWALYLTLLILILFLCIGSQRMQRMIPVLEANKNTTVHFIKTIGGLYHREGDHKNVALKIINHFLKNLSARYYIRQFNEASFHTLAAKMGVPVESVIETFNLIHEAKSSKKLSEEQLNTLYQKINLLNQAPI